jgi:hypothetical protein
MKSPWFGDHSNIVTLVSYMADNGYNAQDIAYAVEKPWKYEDVFLSAIAEELTTIQEDDEIE